MGCGAAPPIAIQALPAPARVEERSAQIGALGRMLFDALQGPGLAAVLADGAALDALLLPDMRARWTAQRAGVGSSAMRVLAPWVGLWAGFEYTGACAQRVRETSPGGALGLRRTSWVAERVLVAAHSGPVRSGAWVDGTFVLTNQGWRAIVVTHVDTPRAANSDLELAPCDVQQGIR